MGWAGVTVIWFTVSLACGAMLYVALCQADVYFDATHPKPDCPTYEATP
jgi:hypothetical protein